ncbi:MAG: nucleotidyltransferase family protein [bacterium]
MPKTIKARPSREQVFEILRQKLPDLRARYGVLSLGVFGSFVRGEQKRRSDLDLLVEFDESELTLFEIVGLERELSSLLGIKVDLVEKGGLKPAIGKHILAEVLPV